MSNSIDVVINQDLVADHDKYETLFRSGASRMVQGINEMALSLYHIQDTGSWRVAKDDEEKIFPTWSHYVKWLADSTGLSRSTVFDYKSMVKFALTNGLVEDEVGFIERGGVLTFRRIKSQTVCNYNGAIISLKGVDDVEDPVEVVREAVKTMDPDLRPMDQVSLIKEVIEGTGNVVDIFFRLKINEDGGHDLIWIKESNIGHEEGLLREPSPDDILTALKSRFHILE